MATMDDMAAAASPTDLDQRRGWACARATVTALVGVVVIGLSAGCFVMLGLAATARFWTWIRRRDIDRTELWGRAPEAFAVAGAAAIVVSIAIAFGWFWAGAIDLVLEEVKATPLTEAARQERFRMVRNVSEELSIGLGRPVPELYVTEDPTPNALSLRSSRRRVLCVTSATSDLPRDECEALVAHELGHLWARDAHWVTSGMVGLSRAGRAGTALAAAGAIVVTIMGAAAWQGVGFFWSTFVFGVVLTVVGISSGSMLRRLELSMRRHADVIADVAAIRLAKNPASLASLCARLARNPSTVKSASWRSEFLWFEMTESVDLATREVDPATPQRTRRELIQRAQVAYAQARIPVPEPHASAFADWLAANPDDTPSTSRAGRPM
jgi:heat shock protein HtpX